MRTDDEVLQTILERIRAARDLDFRRYKRAMVRRRIALRMAERGCEDPRRYLQLLERSPQEYDALVSSLLVKATSFFRDPQPWDALAARALPELLAGRRPQDEIRAWSAGCATGEEAYSAAMVLFELLGPAVARRRVRVFATDVDAAALAFARRGVYARPRLAGLSEERVERFFTRTREGHAVRKDLRRCVVFGVNDVARDAPISRLDLLLCRNVLVYLDAELQKRVLSRFHGALRPGGLLVLGRSEPIPYAAKLYEAVDPGRRIYRRGADEASRAVLAAGDAVAPEPDGAARAARRRPSGRGRTERAAALRRLDGGARVRRQNAAGHLRDAEERSRADGARAARAELEAANEQLETANEELRSTVDELELMNEQLQATNAELEATNHDVARRTAELDLLRLRERAIAGHVSAAVVVLDARGRVAAWNPAAEGMLGVREREVRGRVLWALGLPVLSAELARRVRRALARGVASRVDGVGYERPGAGRGHATFTVVPLAGGDRPQGAVVLLEDTTQAGRAAEERLRAPARRRGRGGDGQGGPRR